MEPPEPVDPRDPSGPRFNLFDVYGTEAFRWTKEDGMIALGDLLGADPGPDRRSSAVAVSADGSVVVGNALSPDGSRAFIWDEDHSLRSVATVLASLGLAHELQGWELGSVVDVSADGTTLLGNGINPRGLPEPWIAVVPEPTSWTFAAAGFFLVLNQRKRRIEVKNIGRPK